MDRIVAINEAAKGLRTCSKHPAKLLKTAGNCTSFGLNGTHIYRNSNISKGTRLQPPRGTSKLNAPKGLQPIISSKNHQSGVNWLPANNLRKCDVREKPIGHYLTKYNQAFAGELGLRGEYKDCSIFANRLAGPPPDDDHEFTDRAGTESQGQLRLHLARLPEEHRR
jgi:hypothetical protein